MPKQTDSIELTNSLQGTVEYTASQEIIPEEKILEQGDFTYTSNGERTENPSEGYDGFSQVAVNVNVQPVLQSKSVSYTENNDYTISPDDGYQGLSSVAVNVNVPQGPVEAPENDVEFIDYDGTIVYSYTVQEFLALTEMPANPTHEGLTAQGWNWTLADAKEYVGDYGGLVIGQMYVTDDGKTRFYIDLIDTLSISLGLNFLGTIVIDWGDGSATETINNANLTTTYTPHTYSVSGSYVVVITPPPEDDGRIYLNGANNANAFIFGANSGKILKKIETGNKIYLNSCGLYRCYTLETISVTNGFFANGGVSRVFENCNSLKAIVVSPVNNLAEVSFAFLYSLKRISFPKELTTIGDFFMDKCCSLAKVYLPEVTDTKTYTFRENNATNKRVVTSSVTTIGAATFYNNNSLSEIKFTATTPPSVSNSNAFYNINLACVIYVPYSEDHSVLNAYKTATNYPNPSTYTYVEY